MATTPTPTSTPPSGSASSPTSAPSPTVPEPALPVFGDRRPDAMELAIMEGRVTDSKGAPISPDAAKPVIPHILDDKQQESLRGELKPGEIGWVELDEKGAPVGGAKKFPPRDKPAAPVSTVVSLTPNVLSTPAGAFLTDAGMQPSPNTNKYKTGSYDRDYNAIAEAVNKRDGNIVPASTSK